MTNLQGGDGDAIDITLRSVSAFLMSEIVKLSCEFHVAYPGGTFKWMVADVGRLMQYFVDECPPFREMTSAVGDHQFRLLGPIFHLDGITPGNL